MMLRMVKMKWSRPQTKKRKSRSGIHLSSSITCREQGSCHSLLSPALTPRSPPAPHHVLQLRPLQGQLAWEDERRGLLPEQGQQRLLVLGEGQEVSQCSLWDTPPGVMGLLCIPFPPPNLLSTPGIDLIEIGGDVAVVKANLVAVLIGVLESPGERGQVWGEGGTGCSLKDPSLVFMSLPRPAAKEAPQPSVPTAGTGVSHPHPLTIPRLTRRRRRGR